MRADNHGEGGILALLALVRARARRRGQRAPRRASVLVAARPVRRGAALRRRHDHAGHLGALRGRGPRGRDHRASRRFVVPITVRASWSRSSSVQKRGTGGIGAVFGPVMLVWFVAIAAARACPGSCATPTILRRGRTRSYAVRFFVAPRLARLPRARLGRPRASPAARRSTPTWATSARAPIRARLVRCRVPGAAAQLLRPGRAAARARPRRPPTRSSRWCRARWLLPDGRPRHRRDGDRVAGADLGRVLAHAARRCSSATCRA